MDTDEILKVKEVAAMLRVSRSTVYTLIKTGQIVATYVNKNTVKRKHPRIKMSAVEEYMKKNYICETPST
jgi:excisionase family DNA binding protein